MISLKRKKKIGEILSEIKPMQLTLGIQGSSFVEYLPKKTLDQSPVREYSHITVYLHCRGAAHVSCNLNYKESRKIPVIFHN